MKITKSTLKKLIKEELESALSEQNTLAESEVDREGSIAMAKILQQYGIGIRNLHAWIKIGLENKFLDRRVSHMDTNI